MMKLKRKQHSQGAADESSAAKYAGQGQQPANKKAKSAAQVIDLSKLPVEFPLTLAKPRQGQN